MEKIVVKRTPKFYRNIVIYIVLLIAMLIVVVLYRRHNNNYNSGILNVALFTGIYMMPYILLSQPIIAYLFNVKELIIDEEKITTKRKIYYYKDLKSINLSQKLLIDFIGFKKRNCIALCFPGYQTIYVVEGLHTNYDEVKTFLEEHYPAHLLAVKNL